MLDAVSEIRTFATSGRKQLYHLIIRQMRTTWRDPASSIVGLAQSLIMAFILGSVFFQLGFIAPASIQGRTGVLFFIMINDAFSLSQAGISWVEERLLVNRERASGTYGDLPYFVAKVSSSQKFVLFFYLLLQGTVTVFFVSRCSIIRQCLWRPRFRSCKLGCLSQSCTGWLD